ncbi:hypothetical protein Droror1_Dr00010174 [Drosera rotundifolia]
MSFMLQKNVAPSYLQCVPFVLMTLMGCPYSIFGVRELELNDREKMKVVAIAIERKIPYASGGRLLAVKLFQGARRQEMESTFSWYFVAAKSLQAQIPSNSYPV